MTITDSVTATQAADTQVEMTAEMTAEMTVASVRTCADGVAAITLTSPGTGALPEWEPGAHIEITLPSGRVRQYSLCSDPADRGSYTVGVLRVDEADGGKGGSAELHTLAVGDTVLASAPRNHFPFDTGQARYVFIAGGIGVTPIIPMARAAQAAGADWEIHYAGRRRATMAFVEELEGLDPTRVRLYPKAECGGRLSVRDLLAASAAGTHVYACGPGSMLTEILDCAAGWPDGAVRIEQFESLGTADMAALTAGEAFEVEIEATGQVVAIADGVSILDALREAGCDVASSCEEGFCGLCETPVVSGEIDHRDEFLTDEERQSGDRMMLCVSRCASPCSRLVIDLQ